MGYVFRSDDAERLNAWFQREPGRSAALLEKELLLRLWSPLSSQRVLQVGCGTGIFLEWMDQLGHQVTGIDPSSAMLSIASRRLPGRVTLDRGYAENLPYEENAFDTVALITTLEFVDDPSTALREAFRVARRHVLIGALNRYSPTSWSKLMQSLWRPSVYRHAQLFSVFMLRRLIEDALSGPVPLRWRTCLSLPLGLLPYVRFIERSRLLQWHPFGHFIAMRVDLSYPMQSIQEPLFADISSRMSHASAHTSCCFPPALIKCYNNYRSEHERIQMPGKMGRKPAANG